MALQKGPKDLVCSARGCDQNAQYAIVWSNPALHFGRTKTWLACSKHVESLQKYLAAREFPVEIRPLEEFLADEDASPNLN